jgi:hypothetical protein
MKKCLEKPVKKALKKPVKKKMKNMVVLYENNGGIGSGLGGSSGGPGFSHVCGGQGSG